MLAQFQPPQGTELMGWTNELDEVSFWSERLSRQSSHSLYDHVTALGWICVWKETREVRLDRTNADARNWWASVQGRITFSHCKHWLRINGSTMLCKVKTVVIHTSWIGLNLIVKK
jgi:hypothetical protein